MGLRNPAPAVLYILHCGNLYGTERMALATLAGMTEYDRRVVFAPSPGGLASVVDAARAAGFEAVTFDSRWQLVKRLLPWFLRYRSVDVIGTGVVHNLVCHALGKLLRVRVRQLQVAHGGTGEGQAWQRKRHLNRIPVRIVAVSDFVRKKLIEYGVRPDRISVIENFLSDAQRQEYRLRPSYDPGRAGARPLDPSRVTVAVVSRVDRVKRIDLLVEAAARPAFAAFEFHIYGTGEDLDVLKARAAALPNVHFHGFVADVKDRLAAADLLVHLCPEEPFGLVILEAFLSKLVAIVPASGGAGSLVEDGVNGLRFAPDDVADLCRVLSAARDLPAPVLQDLADAGSAVLEAKFSQRQGSRRYREALGMSVQAGR